MCFPFGGVPESGTECACRCRRCQRWEFDPWVRKIRWRRKWRPTPVSLPGQAHGQRRLVGYSPWRSRESDTSEWLATRVDTHMIQWQRKPSCQPLTHGLQRLEISTRSPFWLKKNIWPHPPVHGISQARTLQWVVFPSSRGFSPPRDWTHVSCVSLRGRFLTSSTACEVLWPCVYRCYRLPSHPPTFLSITSFLGEGQGETIKALLLPSFGVYSLISFCFFLLSFVCVCVCVCVCTHQSLSRVQLFKTPWM